MKRVAIFQHDENQGPGYLKDFLERSDIPYQIYKPTQGECIPTHAGEFSGLVILGSHHSVNDSLPWIEQELALVKQALYFDCPVLGHCFGGQLLAKALGAEVHTNPRPQIGWENLMVTCHPQSHRLFGGRTQIQAFHWHYQSFSMPPNATRLLYGQYSLNKGFSYGCHIALQCHLEVTAETIQAWCEEGIDEIGNQLGATVQSIDTIIKNLPEKLAALHQISEQVYTQWTRGLARPVRKIAAHHGWIPRTMSSANFIRL